jgi:hypothetical protein
MNKRLTLIPLFLLLNTLVFAQSVEFTPLYGYTISGKVDNYNRSFNVGDDMSFGGILSVEIDHMSYVELSYLRTNTDVVTNRTNNGTFDLAVEHYQVGALREFTEGKVVPFAKGMIGTTRYAQTSKGDGRYWLFSAGFGLGAKIFFTERIGLRLHSNLMLPMQFSGGGFFCGTGGCGTGISFNVPLVHWELGGGLIIRLQN